VKTHPPADPSLRATAPLRLALLLPCPCCSADDAAMDLRLGRDNDGRLACTACGSEFGIDHIRDLVRAWLPVLNDWPAVRAWLGRAPTLSVVEEEDPEGWVQGGEADESEADEAGRRGRPRKPK